MEALIHICSAKGGSLNELATKRSHFIEDRGTHEMEGTSSTASHTLRQLRRQTLESMSGQVSCTTKHANALNKVVEGTSECSMLSRSRKYHCTNQERL